MTLKVKIASGLLATALSGVGTYALIRTGTGRSLDKSDSNDMDVGNEDNVAREDEERSTNEATEPKVEGDAGNETKAAEKTQEQIPNEEDEEEGNPSPEEKAEFKPIPYKEYLISQGITPIDENTSKEDINYTILHRPLPHYISGSGLKANGMFKGSPKIRFEGTRREINGKSMYILNRSSDEDIENLRKACIEALKQIKTNNKNDGVFYKMKHWCAVLKVKDVFKRYKFKAPTEKDDWKKILASEWITKNEYHSKQSFFSTDEMSQLKGDKSEDEKIKLLQDKCTAAMNKKLTRTNFPATKEFLGGDNKADEFQEAIIFCSIPKTAEEYTEKLTARSAVRPQVLSSMKNDYCHIPDKDIEYYKNIKTTDPMEGKSFWCAVRMIHYIKKEAAS